LLCREEARERERARVSVETNAAVRHIYGREGELGGQDHLGEEDKTTAIFTTCGWHGRDSSTGNEASRKAFRCDAPLEAGKG